MFGICEILDRQRRVSEVMSVLRPFVVLKGREEGKRDNKLVLAWNPRRMFVVELKDDKGEGNGGKSCLVRCTDDPHEKRWGEILGDFCRCCVVVCNSSSTHTNHYIFEWRLSLLSQMRRGMCCESQMTSNNADIYLCQLILPFCSLPLLFHNVWKSPEMFHFEFFQNWLILDTQNHVRIHKFMYEFTNSCRNSQIHVQIHKFM